MRLISPVVKPLLAWKAPKPIGDRSTFRVTYPFAMRADGFHGALDMGDYGSGANVVASAPGTVVAEGYVKEPWSQSTKLYPSGNFGGLMVVIDHGRDLHTIYAHMRMTAVSVGDIVAAGQKIGEVGDTGAAAGQAHLHFGVQAPANLVPEGVAVKATKYGIGLDIDPWPLITGQADFSEEDMELPDFNGFVIGTVGGGNNLRKGPTTKARPYLITSPRNFQVVGIVADGGSYKLNGETRTDWAILQGANTWFCAAPLVTDLRLTELGLKLAPKGLTDADIRAALAALNKNVDAWVAQRPRS